MMDSGEQRSDPASPEKPVAPAKTPAARAKNQAPNTGTSIKETLESILVAFILAFIFRAFAVEAFVIPTGSMAPTLMGAHLRYVCPDCGYEFDVNVSPRANSTSEDPDETDIPDNVGPIRQPIFCPNCGYRMPDSMTRLPRVHYGDRILVLKYLYMNWPGSEERHYLFHGPQRWDVVVFKSPTEPETTHYTINFIKRLVGLPGETLMVLDGSIYVKQPGDSTFKIQPKSPRAQDALWRIVYNNDYHPTISDTWHQPWVQSGGSAWSGLGDGPTGRVFDFNDPGGAGTIRFDPHRDPSQQSLSDWLAYDQLSGPPRVQPETQGCNAVSDLKLDLMYTRQAGDGPLRLMLTKLDSAFIAEIAPNRVRLLHQTIKKDIHTDQIVYRGPEEQWGSWVDLPASESGPLHLEFSNVDYCVTLLVNGHKYLQTTPEQYQPDIPDLIRRLNMWRNREPAGQSMDMQPMEMQAILSDNPFGLPSVEVTALRQKCSVAHVSLWRDVYYTPWNPSSSPSDRSLYWGNPPGTGGPNGPITLGPDEYFVMGDNSALSSDARFWSQPLLPELLTNEDLTAQSGRVPGRFLLGKAFFVYWPAGFRAADSTPAFIPDFGDMRFIH